jgi:hypothetical protein
MKRYAAAQKCAAFDRTPGCGLAGGTTSSIVTGSKRSFRGSDRRQVKAGALAPGGL